MTFARGIWIGTGLSVLLHALVFLAFGLLDDPLQHGKSTMITVKMVDNDLLVVQSETIKQSRAGPPQQSAGAPAPADRPAPQQSALPPEAGPVLRPKHYYSPEEVDVKAVPLSDWVLHTEELAPRQIVTLQLKLYVNADGRLDSYEVLASSIEESVTISLLRDLPATPFVTGKRKGEAVPSFVDVEITVENEMAYGPRHPPAFPK